MRIKFLLVSACIVLGFLVTAPVSIARDPWALSGNEKRGQCQMNAGEDKCDFGTYPTRDKRDARGIGGFYIDPLNNIPNDGRIQILYTVQYCNESGWTREYPRPLSSRGNNWISFSSSKNVCKFTYGFYKSSGEPIDLQFEMNYYLNY